MKKAAILLLATAIWLPCLHFVYARTPDPAPLLQRQLALLDRPQLLAEERAPARAANPEWDLMGRSFVAWSLANDALRHPEHTDAALRGIDTILDSVLEVERKEGFRAFLLPYGNGRFALQPERSLFVDSEIALTAALRRLVRDDREDWKRLSRLRAALIAGRIDAAPAGLLESYPDEGWTFDHAVALAALYAVGKLDGDDHNREIERVLSQMKHVLIDARTGLLVSSFTPLGRAHDGPEGSTLWMTLHCLQLVDPAFARDQYQRARGALSASLLGFGWAREWPHGGDADVDSGPVVPLLEVSGLQRPGLHRRRQLRRPRLPAPSLDDARFRRLPRRRRAGAQVRRLQSSGRRGAAVRADAGSGLGEAAMTPKKLLQRAAILALVYALLHLAGGRHDAAFLSGTPVGSLVLGCAYVVVYFLFVIVAPILVIAAGLLHVSVPGVLGTFRRPRA